MTWRVGIAAEVQDRLGYLCYGNEPMSGYLDSATYVRCPIVQYMKFVVEFAWALVFWESRFQSS